MTIHHIKNMTENSLARKVWVEQVSNQWPGLALEVKGICEELGIPDVNKADLTKNEVKKLVTTACKEKDEVYMKQKMENSKKMEDIIDDNCELKPYLKNLTLHQARDLFKIRTNMIKLRENYKNDKTNKSVNYVCVGCKQEKEVNAHVLVCPAYAHLRKGPVTNFDSDKELVEFFCKVMQSRSREDRA